VRVQPEDLIQFMDANKRNSHTDTCSAPGYSGKKERVSVGSRLEG
jgi:hypothetical protein